MIRIVGACLLAAAAIGSLTASAAQAEQFEFGQCQKAEKVGKEYKGKYSDKNCTTEVTSGGKYEFIPLPEGTARQQGGKGKGMTITVPASGVSVKCSKSSATGTLTGPKDGEETIAFSGCSSAAGTCSTAGGGKGEIQAKVKVKLDYTPPKTVSIEITFGKNATAAVMIKCGTTEFGLYGSTDGIESGNVDVMSSKALDTWSGPGELVVEAGGVAASAEFSASLALKNEKLEVKTHE